VTETALRSTAVRSRALPKPAIGAASYLEVTSDVSSTGGEADIPVRYSDVNTVITACVKCDCGLAIDNAPTVDLALYHTMVPLNSGVSAILFQYAGTLTTHGDGISVSTSGWTDGGHGSNVNWVVTYS
jgi:hypothetical protein